MVSEAAVASYEPTVILDALGGPFTDAAIAAIANKGRLVVYGTSNDERVTINLRRLYRKGVTLLGYSGLVETAEEQRVRPRHVVGDDGRRKPTRLSARLATRGARADAHARILARGVEGKIVLDCQK